MNISQFGKKIFFLYPHSVIASDVLHDLIRNEYEVYILKDHQKVKSLLKKYNDSILYINIDENLSEQEWIEFVNSIVNDENLKNIQIGVLTYNENEKLAEKYLIDLSITGGFIRLTLGKAKSKSIILKTLDVNESKGKRKYIRATSNGKLNSTFNVEIASEMVNGKINDISSAGMSCIFDNPINLNKNTLLRNIQLKLNGKLLLLDAIIFGSREISDDVKIMVMLFTNNITEGSKSKIHEYIGKVLQSNIETEIKELYS